MASRKSSSLDASCVHKLTLVLAYVMGRASRHADASHFWLNEGWTSYIERVLQEKLHSPAHRGFSFLIGYKALQDALKQYEERPKYQRLIIDFEIGEDPDDAYSSVPYEKGANLLLHLGEHFRMYDTLVVVTHALATCRTEARRAGSLPSLCPGLCQHLHGQEHQHGHLESSPL